MLRLIISGGEDEAKGKGDGGAEKRAALKPKARRYDGTAQTQNRRLAACATTLR
jgi:hypothetical protein